MRREALRCLLTQVIPALEATEWSHPRVPPPGLLACIYITHVAYLKAQADYGLPSHEHWCKYFNSNSSTHPLPHSHFFYFFKLSTIEGSTLINRHQFFTKKWALMKKQLVFFKGDNFAIFCSIREMERTASCQRKEFNLLNIAIKNVVTTNQFFIFVYTMLWRNC